MRALDAIKRLVSRKNLLGDVMALAGGTAVSQGLIIVSSPLLTRLYTPADFGILAVYASILGIFSVIASLRYEFAIPIADNDSDATNLLALSFVLVALFSLFVTAVVVLWGKSLAAWGNVAQMEPYLWLIPVGILAIGILQAVNYWYTRQKSFSHLGIAKTLQSASQVFLQAAAGLGSLGAVGLVAGHALGRAAAAVYLLKRLKVKPKRISLGALRYVAYRYRKFPLYTAWASLINVVGTQAPAIMFTKLFSPEAAGLFSLTVRILSLPAALIGQAIGQAIYPRLAERDRGDGDASRMIGDTAIVLVMIAFPIFAFIGAFGPPIFATLFGNEWRQAGLYARYMSPWLFLAFVSSPLSMFVFVKEKQGVAFALTLYETTLRLGSIWLGKLLGSPGWSVGLYSIAGTIISFIYLVWVFYLADLSVMKWLEKYKLYFASMLGVLAITIILSAKGGVVAISISLVLLSVHMWLAIRRYGRVFYG